MVRDARRLRECGTWVFDLDNTLYPPSASMFDEIDRRMCAYIAEYLKLDHAEAYKVQKRYFREHGTSLKGLMDN
ncbi:MAG: pyrimidine 5'-nucleotidase, partial [Rhodospirillales bacterium]|nr:pyrimidine 5'-nucleotidase [Rhodospirillales bacterium]